MNENSFSNVEKSSEAVVRKKPSSKIEAKIRLRRCNNYVDKTEKSLEKLSRFLEKTEDNVKTSFLENNRNYDESNGSSTDSESSPNFQSSKQHIELVEFETTRLLPVTRQRNVSREALRLEIRDSEQYFHTDEIFRENKNDDSENICDADKFVELKELDDSKEIGECENIVGTEKNDDLQKENDSKTSEASEESSNSCESDDLGQSSEKSENFELFDDSEKSIDSEKKPCDEDKLANPESIAEFESIPEETGDPEVSKFHLEIHGIDSENTTLRKTIKTQSQTQVMKEKNIEIRRVSTEGKISDSEQFKKIQDFSSGRKDTSQQNLENIQVEETDEIPKENLQDIRENSQEIIDHLSPEGKELSPEEKELSLRKSTKKRVLKWETILETQHRRISPEISDILNKSTEATNKFAIEKNNAILPETIENLSKRCRCSKVRVNSFKEKRHEAYEALRRELPKILIKRRYLQNIHQSENEIQGKSKHCYNVSNLNSPNFVQNATNSESVAFDNSVERNFPITSPRIKLSRGDSVDKSESIPWQRHPIESSKFRVTSILKHRKSQSPRRVWFRSSVDVIDEKPWDDHQNLYQKSETTNRSPRNSQNCCRAHWEFLNAVEQENLSESDDFVQDWETPVDENFSRDPRDVKYPRETREAMNILMTRQREKVSSRNNSNQFYY